MIKMRLPFVPVQNVSINYILFAMTVVSVVITTDTISNFKKEIERNTAVMRQRVSQSAIKTPVPTIGMSYFLTILLIKFG